MRVPLTLVLAACLAGAQDTATFRAGVSLVHVDAEVTAADGRIVGGLHQDDFRVLDEGKQQSILQFATEDEPLDLILLFDISGSMRAVVQEVAAAAHEGFKELQQGDRVCIMVFNRRSRVVAPFTEDLNAVDRTIQRDVLGIPFGGSTFIQEAVDDAALLFLHEKRTQRRRAVLIITDNIGVRSRREETVVRDFWEADALLSGLIVRNPKYEALRGVSVVLAPQSLAMRAGMKGIAEKTGGDFIPSADAGTAFQEAMRRIRSRYALYYALPEAKPGTRRAIRVELAQTAAKQYPKARVRARTGYLVPAKAEGVPGN